jgi:hypothetical protein
LLAGGVYSGAALLLVVAYAVMLNHAYRVLFVNADQARSWSLLEVVSIGIIGYIYFDSRFFDVRPASD